MDSALLGSRLLVAVVFAAAGLAKLANRSGSRHAMIDFGLPPPLAVPMATLLPVAELALAIALLPRATAWFAALAALALLLVFMAVIGWNLARGRRPNCNCFGQMSTGPIGWRTLARNAMLAVPAALIVVHGRSDPGTSAVQWLTRLSPSEAAGLALATLGYTLLALLSVLAFNLMRQQGRLLNRLDELETALASGEAAQPRVLNPAASAQAVYGLPVGARAPAFALSGLHGETLTLDALCAQQKPLLLLFSDPGCGPCSTLLPDVGRWQREYVGQLTTVVISRGTVAANRAKSTEHGVTSILLQQNDEVAQAYHSAGTPSGVIVLPDGTIGSPIKPGVDALRELVQTTIAALGTHATSALEPAAARPGRTALPVLPPNGLNGGNGSVAAPQAPATLQVGDPVPPLSLPDLQGRAISLADFHGHAVLLLFWNLGCGFCQQMLPDLKAWEAAKAQEDPRLLIVSTGTVEANQSMELQSPVVLDQGSDVGAIFGARGTPMAVLVDDAGKVASSVAAGAPAVFALMESACNRSL